MLLASGKGNLVQVNRIVKKGDYVAILKDKHTDVSLALDNHSKTMTQSLQPNTKLIKGPQNYGPNVILIRVVTSILLRICDRNLRSMSMIGDCIKIVSPKRHVTN